LLLADWKRPIRIGMSAKVFRYEPLTRDRTHDFKNPWVSDTTADQIALDHGSTRPDKRILVPLRLQFDLSAINEMRVGQDQR
jgi:hypothetical protein